MLSVYNDVVARVMILDAARKDKGVIASRFIQQHYTEKWTELELARGLFGEAEELPNLR